MLLTGGDFVRLNGSMTGRRPRILLISPRGPLYRHRSGIWKKSLRHAPLTLTTLAGDIKSVALHHLGGWSRRFAGDEI